MDCFVCWPDKSPFVNQLTQYEACYWI